jgi:voltage-gated potassium channel
MPQPATQKKTNGIADLFLSHFIPSVFIGALFLDFIEEGAHPLINVLITNKGVLSYLIVAALNGALTSAVIFLAQLLRDRRYRKKKRYFFSKPLDQSQRLKVAGITFLSGFSVTSLFFSAWGLPIVILIMTVVVIDLNKFAHRIVHMLRPGRAITWEDAGYLIQIYITMLTAFTMLNLTVQWISDIIPSVPSAFNAIEEHHAILNALYFTISMMTTVGFGDIHPISPLAKACVALECLTSYFMFALIIGAITRGVVQTPGQPPGINKIP